MDYHIKIVWLLLTCLVTWGGISDALAQNFLLPDGAELDVITICRSDKLELIAKSISPPLASSSGAVTIYTSTGSSSSFAHPPIFEGLKIGFNNKAWHSSEFNLPNPCLIIVFKLTDHLGNPQHSDCLWSGKWESIEYEDKVFKSINSASKPAQWSVSLLDPENGQKLLCYGPLTACVADGRNWVWLPNYIREDENIVLLLHRQGQPDYRFMIKNPARQKKVQWRTDRFPVVRKGDGWTLKGKGLSIGAKKDAPIPCINYQFSPKKNSFQKQNSWRVTNFATEDNLGNRAGRSTFMSGDFHELDRADQVRMWYRIERSYQYRWELSELEIIGSVKVPVPPVAGKHPVVTGKIGKNKINLNKITFWQSDDREFEPGIPCWSMQIEGEGLDDKTFSTYIEDRKYTLIADGELHSSVKIIGEGGKTSLETKNASLKSIKLVDEKVYSYQKIYYFSGKLGYPPGTRIYIGRIPKSKPEEVSFTIDTEQLRRD